MIDLTLLMDQLRALINKERFSAHMPGHGYKVLHDTNWYELDTTEIDGADNLFAMQGILKQSTQDIAKIYNAKQSRLLVGGSSSGLLASIMAVKDLGSQILVPSDAHKSVFNGIELAGLTALKIQPKYSDDGMSLGYDARAFIDRLNQNPEIKCALITTPNYYGYITDIAPIADVLKKRQGILIVDEAHGAHLNFTSKKYKQALAMGADIVVHSAHKTLPALTQSAMLHFSHSIADTWISKVDKYLEMLQTSSPSYVLMASTDLAVKHLGQNHEDCLKTEQMLLNQVQRPIFQKLLSQKLPDDVFKWWLNVQLLGYTGYEFADYLKSCGIYCEFATLHGTLLYFSFNTREEDTNYLAMCIDKLAPKKPKRSLGYKPVLADKVKIEGQKIVQIPLNQAKNRIIAERVIVYPPGTVLIDKGEVIGDNIFNQLLALKQSNHTVMGISDQTLNTLQVYE